MKRLVCTALCVAAMAGSPAPAAILFQQAVDPTNGVAHFNSAWLSTAPGKTWIGVEGGRLASAQASIGADYIGLFWQPTFDDPDVTREIAANGYSTSLNCLTTIGNGFCASPFFGKPALVARMSGTVFQVDWQGFVPFNRCEPFNGDYFARCAAFGFESYGDVYRLTANATGRVTFTIYDNNPTGNAIPEPDSWAMLIAGFGLTGAALRRRRTVQAFNRA